MTDLNINLTIRAPEAEALIDLLKQCFAADLQKRDDGAAAPAAKPEAPAATAAQTAPAPEANDGAAIASEDTAAEPTAEPAQEQQDGAAIAPEDQPDAGEARPQFETIADLKAYCMPLLAGLSFEPPMTAAQFVADLCKPFGASSFTHLEPKDFDAYAASFSAAVQKMKA